MSDLEFVTVRRGRLKALMLLVLGLALLCYGPLSALQAGRTGAVQPDLPGAARSGPLFYAAVVGRTVFNVTVGLLCLLAAARWVRAPYGAEYRWRPGEVVVSRPRSADDPAA